MTDMFEITVFDEKRDIFQVSADMRYFEYALQLVETYKKKPGKVVFRFFKL